MKRPNCLQNRIRYFLIFAVIANGPSTGGADAIWSVPTRLDDSHAPHLAVLHVPARLSDSTDGLLIHRTALPSLCVMAESMQVRQVELARAFLDRKRHVSQRPPTPVQHHCFVRGPYFGTGEDGIEVF